MNDQRAIQSVLQMKLTEFQLKNAAFSLRAFSKRLEMSPGAVSQILNGKRFISKKVAQKICDKLLLDPQEKLEIVGLFPEQKKEILNNTASEPNYLQLQSDQFRVISDWYYLAILSLIKIRGFKQKPQWISKRLGISEKEAKEALTRLKRLGLIEKDKKGGFKRSAPRYRTSDDTKDLSVQKSHFQSLELAQKSLATNAVQERDFTSITMAINSKKLDQAKVLIRKFQDKLSGFLEDSTPNKVYRLCIQLFPLTKGGK